MMDTSGIGQLKLRLQRMGGIAEVADATLKEAAGELRDKARDMAPIDYGDLKAAITVRRLGAQGAGGRFVKGVSNYEVYVNNDAPVHDKQGVDSVGEYAWLVHEHMGWASQPNPQFMPSQESVDAGLEKGVEAGGKFLERATLELKVKFEERLAAIVLKYLEGLDF